MKKISFMLLIGWIFALTGDELAQQMDSRKTPIDSNLLKTPGKILIYTTSTNSSNQINHNVEYVKVNPSKKGVDISNVLEDLAKRGCVTILVEGGSDILGSFFDLKLVNKAVIFISPKILGGQNAISAVGGEGYNYINLTFPWKGKKNSGNVQDLQSLADSTVFYNKVSIEHVENIFDIQGRASDIIAFLLKMAEKKEIQKYIFSIFHDESGRFNLKVNLNSI